MIVTQAEIDQIKSRIRRRVIELPVQQGEHGELKRCPLREEGVYTLRARVEYHRERLRAEQQPSRARAVLRLIDACSTPASTVEITVMSVERQGDTWLVKFEKGNWQAQSDRPVYLSRENDFTVVASRQTVKGDPPLMTPLAEDLRKARAKALEKRVTPLQERLARLHADTGELRKAMTAMKARNRLALALKEIEKAQEELSVQEPATLPQSVCAVRQAPSAVEGEPRPHGTESPVRLQPDRDAA